MVALVLKLYPWLLSSVGLSHLFSMHALILIIGIAFVVFAVPETRGMTLTQLATLFGGEIMQKSPDVEQPGIIEENSLLHNNLDDPKV